MGKVINLADINLDEYRRTCQNCDYWRPPEKLGANLVKDSRCGHPGGWTMNFKTYTCNEFKRKRRE
jgi:hypothetical protein